MPNLLITGVTGFLGSVLAERLLGSGFKVIGVDRREKGFLSPRVFGHKDFSFFKVDINRKGRLSACLRQNKIKAIFHLASRQPSSREISYEDYYNGNVLSAFNVARAAGENRVELLVFTSTVSVYGSLPGGGAIDIGTHPEPLNYYGLSKYMAEKILEIGLNGTQAKLAIVRFSSLYGKNHLGGLVHTFYQSAIRNEPINVFSMGRRYKNLLHVYDAGAILERIFKNRRKLSRRELFLAGSRNSLKMKDIALLLKGLTGSQSPVILDSRGAPYDHDILLDISRAKRVLGFKPMSIEEGLRLYVKEMRNEI
ncbi:MAG: NAD(P)-dependent oxidoreductase [Candidatus Omnitrophica bacterium]|nr:NAD(P)-dependent oxidoreductase [Candidatus Omnitrophota bacterium]